METEFLLVPQKVTGDDNIELLKVFNRFITAGDAFPELLASLNGAQ